MECDDYPVGAGLSRPEQERSIFVETGVENPSMFYAAASLAESLCLLARFLFFFKYLKKNKNLASKQSDSANDAAA